MKPKTATEPAEAVLYEVLQTRHFVAIGLKHKGEIVSLPADLAKQYVSQGFMARAKRAAADPAEDKKE